MSPILCGTCLAFGVVGIYPIARKQGLLKKRKQGLMKKSSGFQEWWVSGVLRSDVSSTMKT